MHNAAIVEHGPCPQHRMRFVNVRRAAGLEPPSVEPVVTTAQGVPTVADLVEATRVEREGRGETGETA